MKIGKIIQLADAPKGARIIVCGGRTYGWPKKWYASEEERLSDLRGRIAYEKKKLAEVLDFLAPKEIAEGEAPGADLLSRAWAESRGVPCRKYAALWKVEGVAAGPKRNRRMFDGFEGDGTVAFPGGVGTTDMENVTLDGGAWLVRVRGLS